MGEMISIWKDIPNAPLDWQPQVIIAGKIDELADSTNVGGGWYLGTLHYRNENRQITNPCFEVGTVDFGEVKIPEWATFYGIDADIGIEPSFGENPLRIVYIRWEPYGYDVTGGGDRLYLYFPAFGINKSIPWPPWDKPGSLTFDMGEADEKIFKFGIYIYIDGVRVARTPSDTYEIKVIRVSESATNATASGAR
ncbi:MAG: hypothetical protein J7L20_04765 [Thermoplasmata archaeon]|nr:hypothetical protein [Thermoplasmata archaeon]